jgi:ferritin-like metal-binding protein YciE
MTDKEHRTKQRLNGIEGQLQQAADRALRNAETHAFHAIFEQSEIARARALEAAHRDVGAHDAYKYANTLVRELREELGE